MTALKTTGAVLLICFFLLMPVIAFGAGIEAAIGIWSQDPSGGLSYKGQTLSVENELKYDSETKLFGRFKIDMPLVIPNIYIMATPMKFEGNGSKSANFQFGDKTFAGSVPFTSSLQLDQYDIALFYNLPFLKTLSLNKLNAEIGLNARIIDLQAEINQASTGLKETKNLTIPIPMVYVGAQFNPVKLIGFEGEFRGIAYSSNHFYDYIGRVKIRPIGPLFISAGYRYQDIKIDQSDIKAEIKFKGPFVETGLEF